MAVTETSAPDGGRVRAIARRAVVGPLQPVADGVWVVRGGVIRGFNAYLIEHEGSVTLFDAGIRPMLGGLRAAVRELGLPLRQIVLSHAHIDHRGCAPALGAPVLCHAAEVRDAQGDGGLRYQDFGGLPTAFARQVIPRITPVNDGGPVRIADVLREGDCVAGFEVVGAAGHAPGQIALWRERDGVLLGGDAFATFDLATLRACAPVLGPAALSFDHEQARRSLAALADLEPRLACPGHGLPVEGDVAGLLRAAARAG